jgi:hypothetical protein
MTRQEFQRLLAYRRASKGMKIAMEGIKPTKRSVKHGTNLPRLDLPVRWQCRPNNDQKSSFWHNK